MATLRQHTGRSCDEASKEIAGRLWNLVIKVLAGLQGWLTEWWVHQDDVVSLTAYIDEGEPFFSVVGEEPAAEDIAVT